MADCSSYNKKFTEKKCCRLLKISKPGQLLQNTQIIIVDLTEKTGHFMERLLCT